MKEYIWQIVIMTITGFLGWLFGKLQTKREQKQTDLEIIERAIAPQLESIRKLTEQNNRLVEMFLNEQSLRLAAEDVSSELKANVAELTREIAGLKRQISKLVKYEKSNTAND